VGFDEESNGHQVYWTEKRSVTVERSVTFVSEQHYNQCDKATNKDQAKERERNREKRGLAQWF